MNGWPPKVTLEALASPEIDDPLAERGPGETAVDACRRAATSRRYFL
jgi:hypothetical protein